MTLLTAATASEMIATTDQRLAWWREARFGLFIHWGVYSVPAGEWQNKPMPAVDRIPAFSEWLMFNCKIPMAEYQALAPRFQPVKFDADAWVQLARDAGMKYIVITSKHHDGFAMFPSAASTWNIADSTPWHRDPLQELAASCRRYGLKLGFYYSQAQDWNNGGAVGLASMGKNAPPRWDSAMEHDMDDYIDKIAVPQVRELCSRYGEFPSIIWWDTPRDMNPSRAARILAAVKELKPDVIMNNRLGGGFHGDTETPENQIPPRGYPNRDWETCMTMNDSWGFKRDDDHWKSADELIRNLCDIASKGGNYLLNVGPNALGEIPAPSIDRLRAVGDWMRVNGSSIHGTGPTPFGAEAGEFNPSKTGDGGNPYFVPKWEWRCTTKPGKLYLHIFKWPTDGRFELKGLVSKITRAFLLAQPDRDLEFDQKNGAASFTLPRQATDPVATVMCVEIADSVPEVSEQIHSNGR